MTHQQREALRAKVEQFATPCPDDCIGIECEHTVKAERAAYDLARAVPDLLDECDELRALLNRACAELCVAASYADEPGIAIGLRTHARACRDTLAAIRQRLGGE